MDTMVLGDPPPSASRLAERERLGLSRHDEVWQREYRMAPAASFEHSRAGVALVSFLSPHVDGRGLCLSLKFNLGSSTDYRVPDLGVHRGAPTGTWLDTAAVVVEVRSPGDDSLAKFAFYFEHGVDEVLVADLTDHAVHWFRRGDDAFVEDTSSALLGVSGFDVARALGWE